MRVLILTTILFWSGLPQLPADARPNVVLLLVDDLGWQDIGCYGGPVRTPALDALASQGVRFTDFHSGSAVCSPSRATFLTGRQHMRTGVYHVLQDSSHNAHLLEREVTIAETLKQAGYATAHFGKWHLGLTSGKRKKPSPTEHGFDYWFGLANGAGPSQKDPVNFMRNGKRVGPLKGYSCQIVVDDAIEWLNGQQSADKPFFLNIWFNEPHSVLAAPDEIVAKYGKLKDPAALYSGAVENTDRAIASLVAKLAEMGALENTLIIYSSDNGSYRADRNGAWRGAKGSNFEGGIRSPGIFYWPRGIKGGRIEKEPSGAVDLLPTICGLAGIDRPKGVHLDGADLSPLLTGSGKFHRSQPLFWYLPTSYPAAMVRDGRYTFMAYRDYKLPQDHREMAALLKRIGEIVGNDDGASGEGNLRSRVFNSSFKDAEANRLRMQYVRLNTFQESWIPLIKKGGFDRFGLYDLDADPNQKRDISAEKPDVAARLKQQLLAINSSIMADAPDWGTAGGRLNVPPKGFTALFNGKDLTGWRVHPKAKGIWSVENGVLKAPGRLDEWMPDIETEKEYRDFVLQIDYRTPTASDTGIFIRELIPVLKMGRREQINIGPGMMGHPVSFHHLTPDIKLEPSQLPRVKSIRPRIGAWHTMRLKLVGRTLTIEVDGEVILREFEYPEGILSKDPCSIALQKHKKQNIEGKMSNMPIEFRNIFIKEIESSSPGPDREPNVPPEGFTALFNGKNFNGWRLSPAVQDAWSIEDGILKAVKPIKDWGSDLRTVKKYRDYVLMVDYRIPKISDSGIYIRGLMPGIGIFDRDRWEQFNLRSRGGTGTLESFRFQPSDRRVEPPRVRHIDPEVGVWHTVTLTLTERTLSAEYDGEKIIDRYEYADGILSMEPSVIRLQKHAPCEIAGVKTDCPIEFRNIFIKEIKPSGFPREIKRPEPNVPPRGFTALFNGKDLTGWKVTQKVKEAWKIEDGVLKAHHEIKEWGADLTTEKNYRDFVLLADFKFPSTSDSGIWFRGVQGIMGGMEQFNLMSVYGTGNLDSLDHLPKDVQRSFRETAYTPFFYCQPDYYRLKKPPVRYIDPQTGVWHTVKLTLIGRTLSAEYDGNIIHDRFEYPEGTISRDPAPIRLQKHVPQTIAGKLYKDCPIEFCNIFIKELEPPDSAEPGEPRESDGHLAKLFAQIEKSDLPETYNPARHQEYVDRRMAGVSREQRARIGQLWKEKRRTDPNMPNRGQSFVKIMEYVAEHER